MLRAYFQYFEYDRDQSYLRCSRKRRSRSFVQGFLKLHYAWTMVGSITVTDIAGAGKTITTSNESELIMNSTGPGRGGEAVSYLSNIQDNSLLSHQIGIVVGTGTTAVTATDVALATTVIDGTSSGTLEYFPCAGTATATSGSTRSFTLERLYRNSSGASITVNEVGIYGLVLIPAGLRGSFCMVRDIVSPGFAVTNGSYMRIIYTLSVTA